MLFAGVVMTLIIGRTFPINRLYFRYIFDTPWEHDMTVERLAEILRALGMITLHDDGTRYEELPPFRRYSHKAVFINNFTKLVGRYLKLTKGDV